MPFGSDTFLFTGKSQLGVQEENVSDKENSPAHP